MPRKFTTALLLVFFPSLIFAQFDFGIKGGLTYDSLGSLSNELNTLSEFKAKAQTGYQLGIYGELNFFTLYLRPELQFNQTKSEFDQNGELSMNKLEMPVLLGYRFFPFLSFFAGPSFQYILSQNSTALNLGALKEKTTVGLQIGTRFQLGRFGLGVRFERGFTDNELTILNNNNLNIGRIDARPKQWIISASYDLKFKEKKGISNF